MKYLTSIEIRNIWNNYFIKHGHLLEEPVPLVPRNDPTLLYINSGVAGLKKYFDGSVTPKCKRLFNIQRAIRTNDIDNVGVTSRHHTLFEMLGFFSIGDYFKKTAIELAFNLLVKEYAMDKDKLYITYYPTDIEAKNYWIALGINEDHLFPMNSNFWEIGEGPCGPNTEIYYDRGEEFDKRLASELFLNDIDNERFVEILNVVFSQYNAVTGVKRENYHELPQKNIDCGGGFERFVSVIQNVSSNFETDLFTPIIRHIEKIYSAKYQDNIKAFRIIADHLRAIVIALNDGADFGNDGRNYILRRLLRRALKFSYSFNINTPHLYHLVDTIKDIFLGIYDIDKNLDKIKNSIKDEETRFLKTLKSGYSLLEKKLAMSGNLLSGDDAFMLYDTYGFPIDLTIEIAKERDIDVDLDGYNLALKEQIERARGARNVSGSFETQIKDILDFKGVSKYIEKDIIDDATVIGIFEDGKRVAKIEENKSALIILSSTNFYAESGGQVADIGALYSESNELLANVVDVKKIKDYHVHFIVSKRKIKEKQSVILRPDVIRKQAISSNHSSAHLLQSALQTVLDKNIHQEGSYVDDLKMHFDYNFHRKPTSAELERIENNVNDNIFKSLSCQICEMSLDEAKNRGFIALFNEKYRDYVRTVSFGDVSRELCGGTHAKNSKDLLCFVILEETSVAAGIRRITATTGRNAINHLFEIREKLKEVGNKIGTPSIIAINEKLDANIKESELLRESIKELSRNFSNVIINSLLKDVKSYNDINFIIAEIDVDKNVFMEIADNLKSRISDYFIALSNKKTNALVVLSSPKAIALNYKANALVKELGLKGGGKEERAQGVSDTKIDLSRFKAFR